jgi:hypothetical protein
LKAAQQTTRSKLSPSNGMADAFPCWKSTRAPASAAFLRAISTNVLLMSRPVTV